MSNPDSQPFNAESVMREQLINQALAETAGDLTNPNEIATATVNALRLLHAELASLIGSQATSALYVRSMQLTRPSFQWLSQATGAPADALFSSLHVTLSSREPNEARQAGVGLLRTLADLLVTLIGEQLTHRLLRSAWGRPADDELSGSKRDE